MAWGAAIGAAASIAQAYMNSRQSDTGTASARQYGYNLALQQQAQAWNEKMYKHRYQWQVDDLEKAGINKLYGLGTAPSPTSGLNSVGMEDDQGNQNKKRELGLQALGLTSEIGARRAQTKLVENQAKTEIINANLKQQEVLGTQLDNVQKQMQNSATPERTKLELKNEQARLENQMKDLQVKNQQIIESNQNISIRKYEARTGRIDAETNAKNARTNARNAQTNARNAETNARNANTNAKVGNSQAWRNYNQAGGYSNSVHIGPFGYSQTR